MSSVTNPVSIDGRIDAELIELGATIPAGRLARCTLPRMVLLLSLLMMTGCVTVHPWERGTLSHPCMQMSPQLGDSHLEHVWSIREGAVGGELGVGGGCGCG
jgi:hypothetical protein